MSTDMLRRLTNCRLLLLLLVTSKTDFRERWVALCSIAETNADQTYVLDDALSVAMEELASSHKMYCTHFTNVFSRLSVCPSRGHEIVCNVGRLLVTCL